MQDDVKAIRDLIDAQAERLSAGDAVALPLEAKPQTDEKSLS